MNAKELKYGNYVTIENKKYHKDISGIIGEVIYIKEVLCDIEKRLFPNSKLSVGVRIGDEIYYQFEEFIQPVIINEEQLYNFGFKKEIYYKPDDSYCLRKNILSHGIISYYPISKTIELGTTSGMNFGATNIKFLHEIQNLYLSITNKELTDK